MSKLLCGIGYDSKRFHPSNTKTYRMWYNMFYRCYNEKIHHKYPTYLGCSVDSQWDDFQDFADWHYSQEFYACGYELDKDLLVKGNKVYSPETCCLLPKALNNLIVDNLSKRGHYPRGVSFNKVMNKYMSGVGINGLYKSLGLFDSPEEASAAYVKAKEAHVRKMAIKWRDKIDARACHALINWTVY